MDSIFLGSFGLIARYYARKSTSLISTGILSILYHVHSTYKPLSKNRRIGYLIRKIQYHDTWSLRMVAP